MIQTSPETLPVTLPETIPKTNQTTEIAQLTENKIILGGIRNEEKNVTLTECELFTGRTHQIRVHLSNEGYPILGDKLYGDMDDNVKRQMLHSYKVSFIHPRTKERKELEIEMYDDMKEFM